MIEVNPLVAEFLLMSIAFIGVLVGSFTDLQKREVADWVNFAMLASAICIRLLYSILTHNWAFLGWGIAGLAMAWLIALMLYYLGQWGGGDAKMLMAFGVLFATYPTIFNFPFSFLILFFLYSLIAGAVMGVFYSIWLAYKSPKQFTKTWVKLSSNKQYTTIQYSMLGLSVVLLFSSFFIQTLSLKLLTASLAIMVAVGTYLWLFIKVIEQGCMLQKVAIKDLVEGDWIVEDVVIDKKIIVKQPSVGLSTQDIKTLHAAQKEHGITSVIVKVGMPFVPAFLFGILCALFVPISLLL